MNEYSEDKNIDCISANPSEISEDIFEDKTYQICGPNDIELVTPKRPTLGPDVLSSTGGSDFFGTQNPSDKLTNQATYTKKTPKQVVTREKKTISVDKINNKPSIPVNNRKNIKVVITKLSSPPKKEKKSAISRDSLQKVYTRKSRNSDAEEIDQMITPSFNSSVCEFTEGEGSTVRINQPKVQNLSTNKLISHISAPRTYFKKESSSTAKPGSHSQRANITNTNIKRTADLHSQAVKEANPQTQTKAQNASKKGLLQDIPVGQTVLGNQQSSYIGKHLYMKGGEIDRDSIKNIVQRASIGSDGLSSPGMNVYKTVPKESNTNPQLSEKIFDFIDKMKLSPPKNMLRPSPAKNIIKPSPAKNIQKPIGRRARPLSYDVVVKNEVADIMCLNCMNMIKGSCAFEHSSVCIAEKSDVKMMDLCSTMQNLDYRINKLKDSLDKQLKVAIRDNHYLSSILNYSISLLSQTEYTKHSILKSREILSNIMVLMKNFKGLPSTMVYADRLLVLGKQKYNEITKLYKEAIGVNRNTISVKSTKELAEELQQKRVELRRTINEKRNSVRHSNSYKNLKLMERSPSVDSNENRRFSNVSLNTELNLRSSIDPIVIKREIRGIADISSDIDKSVGNTSELSASSANSGADPPTQQIHTTEIDEVYTHETRKKQQEDNLKRYFYGLCTTYKRGLGMRNLGYYIETPQLYLACIEEQISVGNWPVFIQKQLKSPEKWVDMNKVQNLRNKIQKTSKSKPSGQRANSKLKVLMNTKCDTIVEDLREESPSMRSFVGSKTSLYVNK